jgi:hypothetical protein
MRAAEGMVLRAAVACLMRLVLCGDGRGSPSGRRRASGCLLLRDPGAAAKRPSTQRAV